MKKWVALRWVFLALWIVGLVVLTFTSPNLANLVREKGNMTLPNNYSTSVAAKIQKQMGTKVEGSTYLAVFHSRDALSAQDKNNIHHTLKKLRDDRKALHINTVNDIFNQPHMKSQLLSKNHHTTIAILQVDTPANLAKIQPYIATLNKEIKTSGVTTYITGSQPINNDENTSAQVGMTRTGLLTVIFILVVLLFVFRSVIAPLIPLFCVGLSFVAARSALSILVQYMNFPVSNYSEIFMITIMFGIGTDYCILLLSRFKEELARGLSKQEATVTMLKTAGSTVLQSAIPVLISFLALSFAHFNLYRSAIAVGVGIIFLVLALFMLLPIFTMLLGRHLFWPMTGSIAEPKSDLWTRAGHLSLGRPILALLLVALFTVPPILLYHGTLSFNSPEEIGNQYPAKAGLNVVTKDFGAGNISPVTIYLKNDVSMKNTNDIAEIERLSTAIAADSHVKKVMSLSRPLGSRLNEIYVTNQSGKVHQGLTQASSGLNTLKTGLSKASSQLGGAQPQLQSAAISVDKLQNGTNQTANGISKLSNALSKIASGIQSGTTGAGEIEQNVQKARTQLKQLESGEQQLQNGYAEVANGLSTLSSQLNSPGSGATTISDAIVQIQTGLTAYIKSNPSAVENPNLQTAFSGLKNLSGALSAQQTQMTTLRSTVAKLSNALDQLNQQSTQISSGLGQFDNGLGQLDQALGQLQSGLGKASTAQNQVVAATPKLSNALKQIASGQEKMKTGFSTFGTQIGALDKGLKQSATGAAKIKNGIDSANDLIAGWSHVSYRQSGIYVPDAILNAADYQKAMKTYLSRNGKITSIQIVMKDDPYSNGGIAHFEALKKALPSYLKGTPFENAKIGISGVASMNSDLKQLAASDYQRAVISVLIGIFIALVIVLRSLTMPLYLMVSLFVTYFSALGFSEIIFMRLLHHTGLTWTTQFFGFILLIALGIDYSIFVMARFNEYETGSIRQRMLLTLGRMGSVIISAVIILCGTFAAMLPSGMLSLIQIATVAMFGLAIYALIMLPLFIPVMVRLFGRANWWPFAGNAHALAVPSDTTRSVDR
ncbi:MMPL family transporter [Sporolactobacillus spathodeae]|uniref:RND superfamily putative drug exporter n=1 Tax=Sporolactobacillus spathodeae TaxID=1465502 RepID=A0ABS2QAC9_9BACL|nr:MMPL family transporter [Sporolactobacillus spathodeae]MBM7658747.1 RND superfamily putative drug exporter [Sporolactobacillus spathodeae]